MFFRKECRFSAVKTIPALTNPSCDIVMERRIRERDRQYVLRYHRNHHRRFDRSIRYIGTVSDRLRLTRDIPAAEVVSCILKINGLKLVGV